MTPYLDTSALAKLVAVEPETTALRQYLEDHRSLRRVSSAPVRARLPRAV